jgi:hypothetical protein
MSAGMNPMVLSAQYSEIPNELQSSDRKKPIPVSVKTMAVSSQSGSASSGSQLNFQISSANGFIKPNSVFIKARVTLTNTGGNAAADTIVAWGNACRNSSAIIERFSVNSGNQLESINNYGSSYVPTLLLHCANQSYKAGDDGLLEGGYRGTANWNTGAGGKTSANQNAWVDVLNGAAFNGNTYVDVCIPLYSNLFSNEKAYPLCLMAQSTQITLDLAVFGKAMYCSAAGYTDFTVSNAQICYDLIQVSPEYLMALKGQMAQGMLYSIPFTSVLSTQFAKQGNSTTYSWGVGLSSLKGVTYSCFAAPTTVTNAKYMISDCTVGTLAGNNFRLFVDGQQQSSMVQDSNSSRFASQQSVFGLLTDVNRSVASGGVLTISTTDYSTSPANYDTIYFVGGQGCLRVNEYQTMAGSQANNLSLIIETDLTAGTVVQANAWHDRILVIDGAGSCNIVL